MANINAGTVEGCVEFLGYTISKGYLNKNTASSIRTGVNRIQAELPEIASADLRSMDVDEVMQRFRTLARGKDIKSESIDEYERRFRQARETYLKFLDDDDSWKVRARPTPARADVPKSTKVAKGRTNLVSVPDVASKPVETPPPGGLITYPFPIRAGLQGRISLPEDLSVREAERIVAFIKTLAMEDETVYTHSPRAIEGRIVE